jgi:hypothetical protein
MVDYKGPLYIKNSIIKDTSSLNGWTLNDYTLIYDKGYVVDGRKGKILSYKNLLHTSLWALVSKSDIIKGIDINRSYKTERNTVVNLDVPGYDVINMSLAYYKTTA